MDLARHIHNNIFGEASVWYLYSSNALFNIYQFNKNARIIVMIRNPIDMVYSLFSQFKFNLYEDQENFEQAWNLQTARKQGQMLPRYCQESYLLQYGQIGMFSEQIERLYSIFPSEQVKIILFDDFINSTKFIYQEVLLFLNLNDDGRIAFPKINENKVFRFQRLHRFINFPPKPLTYFLNYFKSLTKVRRFVIEQIKEWNSIKISRPPLTAEFRQELADYFRNDVKRLSELLDRDLMHWVE